MRPVVSICETVGGLADLKKARRHKAAASADVLKTDRLPPHATAAEQGVLGCVLLSPNDCLGQCIEKLKAGQDVFYDLRHQTIYTALVEMYDQREGIDVITLQQRLKDRQLLDQIGGIPYLNALQDAVPSAANVTYYADIVQEKYLLRKMIQACTGVVAKVYDYEGEVDVLMDEVERDILQISESRVQSGAASFQTLVPEAITRLETAFAQQGRVGGIPSGFRDLDRLTDGFHPGEMVVIAARPALGKTALACNIASYVAISEKLPVAIFSLEMTAEALTSRMLCSEGRTNIRDIRDGFLSHADVARLSAAGTRMSKAAVFIDDRPGLSVLQLRAAARRLHQQFGVKLFVVDYLQLVHATSRAAQDNRNQEVAEISGGLKAMAKEMDVAVLVLSQLNREVEKTARKPRLSDLRESGAIEQDADVVGLLYRPQEQEEEQDHERHPSESVNMLIAKQRNGPTGDVPLRFIRTYTRFENAAQDDPAGPTQADIPGIARAAGNAGRAGADSK